MALLTRLVPEHTVPSQEIRGDNCGVQETGRRLLEKPRCCCPCPQGQIGLCLPAQRLEQNLSGASVSFVSCLCSVGGLILDKTVSDPNFAGMAVFTPVINGEALASAAGEQLDVASVPLGAPAG